MQIMHRWVHLCSPISGTSDLILGTYEHNVVTPNGPMHFKYTDSLPADVIQLSAREVTEVYLAIQALFPIHDNSMAHVTSEALELMGSISHHNNCYSGSQAAIMHMASSSITGGARRERDEDILTQIMSSETGEEDEEVNRNLAEMFVGRHIEVCVKGLYINTPSEKFFFLT